MTISNGIALVEFIDSHRHNMWSMPRMRQLTELMSVLGADDSVRAVVLFSGADRSFGAGGDFHETMTFTGGDEVDIWIDHIADLYISCLRLDRPVIAAIDGYAIGIGLQIALTTDYRIGSDRCVLKMPEFELGIACTFGGYMLDKSIGRGAMQHMLMSCDEWSAEHALRDRLLHECVPAHQLLTTTMSRASRCADFAPAGFRTTKPNLNADYIEGLERTRVVSKAAHRAAFAAGDAQRKMRRVLGGKGRKPTSVREAV
ncbi:MAG: enoyl-CoA hydratase/isomerase family protein [Pseudonocardiales bacterium]